MINTVALVVLGRNRSLLLGQVLDLGVAEKVQTQLK